MGMDSDHWGEKVPNRFRQNKGGQLLALRNIGLEVFTGIARERDAVATGSFLCGHHLDTPRFANSEVWVKWNLDDGKTPASGWRIKTLSEDLSNQWSRPRNPCRPLSELGGHVAGTDRSTLARFLVPFVPICRDAD